MHTASVRAIQDGEISGVPFSFDILPIDLRLNFRYFQGRFMLYNNQIDSAVSYLNDAYNLSLELDSPKN